MTGSRPWLVPATIAATAVVFLIAGVLIWEMTSTGAHCPAHAVCTIAVRHHRRHPVRAELLWAISGLLAIIAAEVALWQRRQVSLRGGRLGETRYRDR
jgi:hypothetical protein